MNLEKESRFKADVETICKDLRPLQQKCVLAAMEKGASSWLSVLPLQHLGYTLNKQEFRDALSLRYSFPIPGIPKFCGCGDRNDVTHALSCKKGGYVIMRHNALRDSLANIMKDVCTDVKIEPQLLPVNANDYQSCTNTSEQARLDISAVGVRGSFERTFFDVQVTHPHAPSNVTLSLPDLYKKHEKEKMDAYEERVAESEKGSFPPMVLLTTGGVGLSMYQYR